MDLYRAVDGWTNLSTDRYESHTYSLIHTTHSQQEKSLSRTLAHQLTRVPLLARPTHYPLPTNCIPTTCCPATECV
ncbi:hypothetical protein M3J09_011700 [Ascochyta lentis]